MHYLVMESPLACIAGGIVKVKGLTFNSHWFQISHLTRPYYDLLPCHPNTVEQMVAIL